MAPFSKLRLRETREFLSFFDLVILHTFYYAPRCVRLYGGRSCGEEGRVEGAQRGNENGYFAPQSERVFAVADCISHPSRCDGFFRLDYAPTHAAPSLAAVSSFVCGKTGTRR